MGKKTKQQGGALDVAWGMIMAKVAVWAAAKSARGLKRLAFRWRRALSPVFFGFLIWVVAAVANLTVPEWWAVALVFPAFGIPVAWFGPKLSDRWGAIVMRLVPSGLDSGKSGVLDRPVERIYFGSLVSLIGVYLAVRTGAGPSEFSGWFWKIGLLLYGGSWWYHRRVRTAGRADRIARKFVKLADRDRCPDTLKPFVGSKVTAVHGTGRTAVLTLRLAEGLTIDVIARLVKPLASYLNLRPGSIFAKEDPNNARTVILTVLPSDPWKGKIQHPMPEPGTITLAQMSKRFAMGLLADGKELIYDLQHTLVVGQTGSGKSIWLHSLMTWLSAASDAVIVAVDMAGGATLGVWRKVLALPLADDLESAMVILERVFAVIEIRERVLGKASEDDDEAADSFEPSKAHPWLVLVIDEFPDLLAEAKQQAMEKQIITLLSRIAKKARKCGVRLVFASQNGTKIDLGSKELQAQLKAIVGLALDAQQNRNLWGELGRLGWNSTTLREGQFLLRDDKHSVAEPAKGFFVPNKERRRHVLASADLQKALEPAAWAALCGVSGPMVMPAAPAEPEEEVLKFLTLEGPARVEKLVEMATVSRATVYRRLAAYEARGLVHKAGGMWRAGPPAADAPADEAGAA